MLSKARRVANTVAGLLLLGALGLYVGNFATADSRVRKLCMEMHEGISVANLNRYAEQHRLGPRARASGTSFVVETTTFGRNGCKVEAADGVVRRVEFNYAH